jgi:hypothetical protein
MYVFNPTKSDEEQRRKSRDSNSSSPGRGGETPRGSDVGLTRDQEGSSGT